MIGALVGGRYKIARLLGTGNMARVYVAEQVNMERNVAVKILQPELLVDETAGGRFQREVVAVSRLRSPHTISFIDSGCTPEGVPYIVMELLVGQTLRERLEEDNPIPWHEVVTVVEQLGHSLHEAHEAGVLHRDLKPDNVHYSHQPTPFQPFIKLLDFGLAKLLDPQNANDMMLTGRRQTVGTPAYMAPEMIVEERPVDHRSDIYALGVMCFEMLTGQRPYQHKGTMQMAMAQVRDPIPSAQAINPTLPEGVDAFIDSVMAKDPVNRPQSAIELASQLRALLAQAS